MAYVLKVNHWNYKVIGESVSVPDAEALAASDTYQFQWWALYRWSSATIQRQKERSGWWNRSGSNSFMM